VSKRTWNFWENGRTRTPVTVLELLRLQSNSATNGARIDVLLVATDSRSGDGSYIFTEHSSRCVAVRVKGDGFPPDIRQGDVVVVDTDAEVFAGNIGLFKTASGETFGRLQSMEGVQQLLGARGPIPSDAEVIGRAIEVRRAMS
jgi:hypothetical protein